MPQTSGPPGSSLYLAEAPPPGFQCTWRGMGFYSTYVHVAGELDIATATLLEQTLRRAERGARLVVLDLRELTFMDSAGVHVIVNASIRARQAGCRLVLVRGSSQVDRVFTLTGAMDVLEIGDLDAVEAPLEVLARLPREDHAA